MDKIKIISRFCKENTKLIKIATMIIIIVVALVFFAEKGEKDDLEIVVPEEGTSTEEEAVSEKEIYVDISGLVKKPGVYKVKEGTRLFQVIELAGGLLKEANEDVLNQAAQVTDGEKVIITGEEEVLTGEETLSDSSNGMVNINTADNTKLQEIPGVGPSTADKIISYRNSNGNFSKIEDIKNVSGIGDKTFDKMKAMICIKK